MGPPYHFWAAVLLALLLPSPAAPAVAGCTTSYALNFDASATSDDGSCKHAAVAKDASFEEGNPAWIVESSTYIGYSPCRLRSVDDSTDAACNAMPAARKPICGAADAARALSGRAPFPRSGSGWLCLGASGAGGDLKGGKNGWMRNACGKLFCKAVETVTQTGVRVPWNAKALYFYLRTYLPSSSDAATSEARLEISSGKASSAACCDGSCTAACQCCVAWKQSPQKARVREDSGWQRAGPFPLARWKNQTVKLSFVSTSVDLTTVWVDDLQFAVSRVGCTSSVAFNFDKLAEVDDGSCVARVSGCTDKRATNYSPKANTPLPGAGGGCVLASFTQKLSLSSPLTGWCSSEKKAACAAQTLEKQRFWRHRLTSDTDGSKVLLRIDSLYGGEKTRVLLYNDTAAVAADPYAGLLHIKEQEVEVSLAAGANYSVVALPPPGRSWLNSSLKFKLDVRADPGAVRLIQPICSNEVIESGEQCFRDSPNGIEARWCDKRCHGMLGEFTLDSDVYRAKEGTLLTVAVKRRLPPRCSDLWKACQSNERLPYDVSQPVSVFVRTKDGTATEPLDYASRNIELTFPPYSGKAADLERSTTISVVLDNSYELTSEQFSVYLALPKLTTDMPVPVALLGFPQEAAVQVLDIDLWMSAMLQAACVTCTVLVILIIGPCMSWAVRTRKDDLVVAAKRAREKRDGKSTRAPLVARDTSHLESASSYGKRRGAVIHDLASTGSALLDSTNSNQRSRDHQAIPEAKVSPDAKASQLASGKSWKSRDSGGSKGLTEDMEGALANSLLGSGGSRRDRKSGDTERRLRRSSLKSVASAQSAAKKLGDGQRRRRSSIRNEDGERSSSKGSKHSSSKGSKKDSHRRRRASAPDNVAAEKKPAATPSGSQVPLALQAAAGITMSRRNRELSEDAANPVVREYSQGSREHRTRRSSLKEGSDRNSRNSRPRRGSVRDDNEKKVRARRSSVKDSAAADASAEQLAGELSPELAGLAMSRRQQADPRARKVADERRESPQSRNAEDEASQPQSSKSSRRGATAGSSISTNAGMFTEASAAIASAEAVLAASSKTCGGKLRLASAAIVGLALFVFSAGLFYTSEVDLSLSSCSAASGDKCHISQLGDGQCNEHCYYSDCKFDGAEMQGGKWTGGDCLNYTEACAETGCFPTGDAWQQFGERSADPPYNRSINLMPVGDGLCDLRCNSSVCRHDGGDCLGKVLSASPQCSPGCYSHMLRDKTCQASCNNRACLYDEGACALGFKGWKQTVLRLSSTAHLMQAGEALGSSVCDREDCAVESAGIRAIIPGRECRERCNTPKCSLDYGACSSAFWCSPGCSPALQFNTQCDAACFTAACNWDALSCRACADVVSRLPTGSAEEQEAGAQVLLGALLGVVLFVIMARVWVSMSLALDGYQDHLGRMLARVDASRNSTVTPLGFEESGPRKDKSLIGHFLPPVWPFAQASALLQTQSNSSYSSEDRESLDVELFNSQLAALSTALSVAALLLVPGMYTLSVAKPGLPMASSQTRLSIGSLFSPSGTCRYENGLSSLAKAQSDSGRLFVDMPESCTGASTEGHIYLAACTACVGFFLAAIWSRHLDLSLLIGAAPRVKNYCLHISGMGVSTNKATELRSRVAKLKWFKDNMEDVSEVHFVWQDVLHLAWARAQQAQRSTQSMMSGERLNTLKKLETKLAESCAMPAYYPRPFSGHAFALVSKQHMARACMQAHKMFIHEHIVDFLLPPAQPKKKKVEPAGPTQEASKLSKFCCCICGILRKRKRSKKASTKKKTPMRIPAAVFRTSEPNDIDFLSLLSGGALEIVAKARGRAAAIAAAFGIVSCLLLSAVMLQQAKLATASPLISALIVVFVSDFSAAVTESVVHKAARFHEHTFSGQRWCVLVASSAVQVCTIALMPYFILGDAYSSNTLQAIASGEISRAGSSKQAGLVSRFAQCENVVAKSLQTALPGLDYVPGGFVDILFATMLVNAVVTPLLRVIAPWTLLKGSFQFLVVGSKYKTRQGQYSFRVETEQAFAVRTTMLAVGFAHLLPVGLAIGALALAASFTTTRFIASRIDSDSKAASKLGAGIGDAEACQTMLRLCSCSVILHAVLMLPISESVRWEANPFIVDGASLSTFGGTALYAAVLYGAAVLSWGRDCVSALLYTALILPVVWQTTAVHPLAGARVFIAAWFLPVMLCSVTNPMAFLLGPLDPVTLVLEDRGQDTELPYHRDTLPFDWKEELETQLVAQYEADS